MIYLRKRLNQSEKQFIPFKKSKHTLSQSEKPIVRTETLVIMLLGK